MEESDNQTMLDADGENAASPGADRQSGMTKLRHDFRQYAVISCVIIITFFICILLFFIVYRYSGVARLWDKLMSIMQPFIFGIVLAYITNPIMMFVEKLLMRFIGPRMKNQKAAKRTARMTGIFTALALVILIVVLLLVLIIPQLIDSIQGVAGNLPDEITSFIAWINEVTRGNTQIMEMLENAINAATDFINTWIQERLIPQANTYIVSITTGVVNVAKIVINVFVGLIISVYLLAAKERFIGQAKKLIYTIFNAKTGNIIIHTARKSNEIFGGFISGKLIDSLIIGILCYIGLMILQMPYPILVSVIVGVTNVIPFFGPYIGAVPSFIIIALANPIKGLYFIIFILVLQQIDGNVIGPKILGDSTGLSPFWVVFAIIVAGGIFGFAGMLLGVPTFAVIYYIAGEIINNRLRKKKLPQDTESYIDADGLDEKDNTIRYRD